MLQLLRFHHCLTKFHTHLRSRCKRMHKKGKRAITVAETSQPATLDVIDIREWKRLVSTTKYQYHNPWTMLQLWQQKSSTNKTRPCCRCNSCSAWYWTWRIRRKHTPLSSMDNTKKDVNKKFEETNLFYVHHVNIKHTFNIENFNFNSLHIISIYIPKRFCLT